MFHNQLTKILENGTKSHRKRGNRELITLSWKYVFGKDGK
jgi:hypothetical protein